MQGVGITAAMVAAQFTEVGLNTMIKSANTNGMNNFVYVVYSNVLAFCILVPSTLLYHRFERLGSVWMRENQRKLEETDG